MKGRSLLEGPKGSLSPVSSASSFSHDYYPGSIDDSSVSSSEERHSRSVASLRSYHKIGSYSSINKNRSPTFGKPIIVTKLSRVSLTERRIDAITGSPNRRKDSPPKLLHKMQTNLDTTTDFRKRLEQTCSSGLPRYQITNEEIKSYNYENYLNEDVPTPWGGVRPMTDVPKLIKNIFPPPSEQHFMEQVDCMPY